MVSVIFMVILLIMFGVATFESAAYGSLGVVILSFIYLLIVPWFQGKKKWFLAFGMYLA